MQYITTSNISVSCYYSITFLATEFDNEHYILTIYSHMLISNTILHKYIVAKSRCLYSGS